MMYLLGVDVGTSVIKAVLFDLQGNELYSAGKETVILHPEAIWAEQDMLSVWQAVTETIQQVLLATRFPAQQIAAIGLTGQGDGTWLVDKDHQPVRPAIIWLDGRVHELLDEFESQGVGKEIFKITGTALNTCNQALQLCWLQQHEPSALNKARSALRAKDWVFLCMTGKTTTDETDASFTYFDINKRTYHPGLLDLLGISHLVSLIPEALPSYRNQAELLPAEATRMGLLPGTPVVSGPFDVSASDLGIGALQPGEACTILGTAGIHQIILDKPEFTPENIGYNMCHAPVDRWVRLLPTMSGTLNLQWFIKEFFQEEFDRSKLNGNNPWDLLEEQARSVPPGANGVLYHPYIDPAGERAPFVFPSARAQFFGLSVHCTRQTLLRAVYEGVVLSALDCYSLMPARVSHLKLGGGGSRSDFWAQMFADALGCPVSVMQAKEFGACGAAINAGLAVGIFSSYEDGVSKMVHPKKQFTPDTTKTPVYQAMHNLYRQIYQSTFPLWEAASRVSKQFQQERLQA